MSPALRSHFFQKGSHWVRHYHDGGLGCNNGQSWGFVFTEDILTTPAPMLTVVDSDCA